MISNIKQHIPSNIYSIIKNKSEKEWGSTLYKSCKGGKNLTAFFHSLIKKADLTNPTLFTIAKSSYEFLKNHSGHLSRGSKKLFFKDSSKFKVIRAKKSAKTDDTTIKQKFQQGLSIDTIIATVKDADVVTSLKLCKKLTTKEPKLLPSAYKIFECAHHIINRWSRNPPKANTYLRKEASKLPFTIEYNAKSNHSFIHLKRHLLPNLGKGFFKTVSFSIVVDPKNPRLVANAVSKKREEREIAIFKVLRGCQNVVSFISESSHANKHDSKKRAHGLVTELYNSGSVKDIVEKGIPLSLKERVTIVQDVLKGLVQIHKNGVRHRDLHLGNILVNIEPVVTTEANRKVHAVISDFNLSRTAKEFKSKKSFQIAINDDIAKFSHNIKSLFENAPFTPEQAGIRTEIYSALSKMFNFNPSEKKDAAYWSSHIHKILKKIQ